MIYYHTDVFCSQALAGNALTVFIGEAFPPASVMQKMAAEFRQYETIFLVRRDAALFAARIFTVDEELAFAGHPVLGAAAAVHREFFPQQEAVKLVLQLRNKRVPVDSSRSGNAYVCGMNQGKAQFLRRLEAEDFADCIAPLNLKPANLAPGLPPEVVSTGLPYLLVPVVSGLETARILSADYGRSLEKVGAKFAYILDVEALEGRTWDNAGRAEDIATGSAAGPAAALLHKYGRLPEKNVVLKQGRFTGRESELAAAITAAGEILVSGGVRLLVCGETTEEFCQP